MPEAHHALGLALLAAERADDAIGAFRRCTELAPERSDLQRRCAEQVGTDE
jgi:cytochrome c-type biogenesis protein CcmH/NrfG